MKASTLAYERRSIMLPRAAGKLMKLPEAEHAVVDAAKVRDYLLSREHAVGRFKAVFFATLGYTRDHWKRLQEDLLALGQSGTAKKIQETRFGQKYEIHGTLAGPSGRRTDVVTIWIVLHGEDFPRFVTVFPGEVR